MPKINSLLFIELKSELLESLQGKYTNDPSYSKVWSDAQMRGSSHSNGSVNASSTQGSALSEDELMQWRNFYIKDGYMLHKGRVCVPMNIATHSVPNFL